MFDGESKNTKKVIIKNNEKGSYGIGSDLLDDFNKNQVTKVTVEKIDGGNKSKNKKKR